MTYGCDISDIKKRLRDETTECTPNPNMLSTMDQAEFMKLLLKLTNAKTGIEVGCFTGYGSLCFAEALPADGKLITLDITDEYPNVGKKYWEEAGVADKIDLRIGAATDSLDELLSDEANLNSFDFAYIDADKPAYNEYYDRCLPLVKSNGYLMIDNYFLEGAL